MIKAETPSAKKFDWEHENYNEEGDEFLKHFDEEGNFIETKEDAVQQEIDSLKINYQYRPNEDRKTTED